MKIVEKAKNESHCKCVPCLVFDPSYFIVFLVLRDFPTINRRFAGYSR